MAFNYSETVKNARLAAVVAAIGASGKLVIGDSTLSGATGVLAEVPFANPAFNVSAGAMTTNALPRTVDAAATGVAVAVQSLACGSLGGIDRPHRHVARRTQTDPFDLARARELREQAAELGIGRRLLHARMLASRHARTSCSGAVRAARVC